MAVGDQLIDSGGNRVIGVSVGDRDVCEACCGVDETTFEHPAIIPDYSGNPRLLFQEDDLKKVFQKNATNAGGSTWSNSFTVVSDFYAFPGLKSPRVGVLGSSATNPGYYWFVGEDDGSPGELFIYVADDAAGASYTATSIKTAEAESVAGALLLSTDNIGVMTFDSGRSPKYEWHYSDEDGENWTQVDGPDLSVNFGDQVALIGGRPAMAFPDGTFMRADDADGTTWPSTAESIGIGFDKIYHMCDVGGVAGIVHVDGGAGSDDLYFIKANNADGTSWASRVQVNDASGADGNDSRVEDAQILYNGSTITILWGTSNVITILSPTATYYTYYGYPYYPTIGYKRAIYSSTSTDGGATWSTPAIEWELEYDLTEGFNGNKLYGQMNAVLDGSDVHCAWCYLYSGGSDPVQLIYDGNVVLENFP